MKLSIIIPVFNEEDTIEEIIKRVFSVPLEKEVIVVDDGSSDKTGEILKRIKGIILLKHEKNRGKGAAVRTGISKASGGLVVVQDADLEYDPREYSKLLAPFSDKKVDVVYGSRILGSRKRGYLAFYLGGRMLTFFANLLYGLNITDESTCYKIFRTEVIKNLGLERDGFEFCAEATAKLAKKGIKIHEVPISYEPRSKKGGKKIKWKDGVISLWTLLKYRL